MQNHNRVNKAVNHIHDHTLREPDDGAGSDVPNPTKLLASGVRAARVRSVVSCCRTLSPVTGEMADVAVSAESRSRPHGEWDRDPASCR
jgi:hypothetical protein